MRMLIKPISDTFFTFNTFSRSRLVQTRYYYLLQYLEKKQIEAVFCRFFSKQMFLKFRRFYRKTPVLESLFNKDAGLKKTQTQVLSCKFAKFLRTRTSTEHLRWLLLNKPKRFLTFIVQRRDFWSLSTSLPPQVYRCHFTFNGTNREKLVLY